MSKAKSISMLVTDLQEENERLIFLKKLFDRACKEEFGLDVKGLHEALQLKDLYEARMAEKQGQQAALPRADRGAAPGQPSDLTTADIGEEWQR